MPGDFNRAFPAGESCDPVPSKLDTGISGCLDISGLGMVPLYRLLTALRLALLLLVGPARSPIFILHA